MTLHTITALKGKPGEREITVDLPDHMTGDEYQQRAMRTLAPQDKAWDRILENPLFWTQLIHSIIGMMGELGEICTAVQNAVWYGKGELDKTNLSEEYGDLAWYHAEGIDALQRSGCIRGLDRVMIANILKLIARYPDKFSEFLAAEENRSRAGEREILEGTITEKDYLAKMDPTTAEIARKACGIDPEDAYVKEPLDKRISRQVAEHVSQGRDVNLTIDGQVVQTIKASDPLAEMNAAARAHVASQQKGDDQPSLQELKNILSQQCSEWQLSRGYFTGLDVELCLRTAVQHALNDAKNQAGDMRSLQEDTAKRVWRNTVHLLRNAMAPEEKTHAPGVGHSY